MVNRWGRNAPYGGAGGGGSGYMGSGVASADFYMGGPTPNDRRPYNVAPVAKPFYGGYREDNYNRRSDRRDDFRGGKRGQRKG
uniref:RNA-binding protein n=1 Tax=Schistosoma mansoni TaxID=6183 RepID=A0A5K4F6K4_SCHMA